MKNYILQRRMLISVLLAAAFVLAACQPAETIPQTGSGNDLRIEFTSEGVVAPQQVASGYVTVTPNNTTQDPRSLMLARLNSDITIDQFSEMFQQNPDSALPLVSFVGGGSAEPGASQPFMAFLSEGTYVAVGFPMSDAPPILGFFQVTPGVEQGAAPASDQTIELIDFDFSLPDNLQAGEQTWEITTTGQQPHELYLVRPDEGFTEEQFLEMMQADEESQGPPPWEDVASFGPVSQGERMWVTLNLEPGTYMAICFIPDPSSGMPHAMLGMIETFEVTE